eukprot:6214584-Pleurochrysis_carterae.AAC.2
MDEITELFKYEPCGGSGPGPSCIRDGKISALTGMGIDLVDGRLRRRGRAHCPSVWTILRWLHAASADQGR